jgi:hypothetical protein
MYEHWSIAHTAAGQFQAQIIAGLLQAAEIEARLSQESAGSVYALTVGPLGEVEVLVPSEQLAAAQELIARYERGELETPDSGESAADPDGPEES